MMASRLKAWPVVRLVAFDHSLVLAPWCVVRAGDAPALQVRRIALALEKKEDAVPAGGRAERALAHLLYLATSLRQIAIVWRPEHRGVRAHYGIGSARQFCDLVRIAWRGNLPPRVYYFQRLFRRANPAEHFAVIEHRELQLLLRAVHAGVDTTVLDDKIAFHAFCEKHALPTPPLVATCANGQLVSPETPSDAWRMDLFSKPARSYASIGIAAWRYDPVRDEHTDGKISLGRAALHAWLAEQSRAQAIVVQPRIGNAPDILSITGRALANCRVVTARRADGTIIVLVAVLRLGLGDAITSDEPTTTFCASVDPETGALRAAGTKQAARGDFTHHPESGAPIAGRVLPRWAHMRALALRAHAAMPQMIFVGWDVVDTDRGVMLLEGNLVWGGNLAQMAGNPPLGTTEFPEIFLHYYQPQVHGHAPPRPTASAPHS